ncbi:MAG: hypothetical protein DHS20C18_40610 [Saprospiraceae bacterium]|nr:MAG: hypothetical protein DHS20C18_40610 [Saprospiraceae bacterium]
MATVNFTSALKRFFPKLDTIQVEGKTVAAVLDQIEQQYPGMKDYLVDERGRLRKHVNIFIGEELITDGETLSDVVAETDQVFVFQALSGG